jgi:hypothetical protein
MRPEGRFFRDCGVYLLKSALGGCDACVTPEKTKACAGFITVGCIEGKPLVKGPENVAWVPLVIAKGTD